MRKHRTSRNAIQVVLQKGNDNDNGNEQDGLIWKKPTAISVFKLLVIHTSKIELLQCPRFVLQLIKKTNFWVRCMWQPLIIDHLYISHFIQSCINKNSLHRNIPFYLIQYPIGKMYIEIQNILKIPYW